MYPVQVKRQIRKKQKQVQYAIFLYYITPEPCPECGEVALKLSYSFVFSCSGVILGEL